MSMAVIYALRTRRAFSGINYYTAAWRSRIGFAASTGYLQTAYLPILLDLKSALGDGGYRAPFLSCLGLPVATAAGQRLHVT